MAVPDKKPHGPRTQTIARHLRERGLDPAQLPAFLVPRLADLSNPEGMVDRERAAARLARAVQANERVVVFGDYDCDGMTATAILSEALEQLGATRISTLLASRFDGGYGLSARALERVVEQEPSLVVTCDCGSSDHESLERLRQLGIDAVVIDHHLVPEEPLPAVAFLNPHRPECGFAYKGLASCGLALSVVAAVRTLLGVPLDLKQWLDLVAIGTIADVAPLDGDNRALVRAGLTQLAKGERPGLCALGDLIGIDRSGTLLSSDISFRIAPRLNAPGRLGPPDLALALLREKDPERARSLALEVEHLCQARREAQKSIELEATADAAEQADEAALVVGRPGWNHGIVGIVAGRLAERFARPTVVVGFEGEIGRGSVRGPAGFPLFDAVRQASSCLVRFGGHQAAAGLELRLERLDEFRLLFQAACHQLRDYAPPPAQLELELEPGDDLAELLLDLYELEPCGQANPAPKLQVSGEVRVCRPLKGGHLKLEIERASGGRLSIFGPGLGQDPPNLGAQVRVVGNLRADRYRGGEAVEFLAERLVIVS